MKTILEVEHVYKKLGKNEVLKGVDLTMTDGEIVGLVGENGAGKTTLFSVITGLLTPDKGNVFILGNKVTKDDRKIFDKVGCLIENVTIYPSMTGLDHVKWMCKLCDCPYDDYVKELITKMKLQNKINDKVRTYSLGMKQRLGIIMALVNKPSLVLLDEPTNGLDPTGIYEIREFLLEMCHKNGMSLLVSSHILAEMEKLCDRVLLLQDGIISKELTKEELSHPQELEKEFIESVQNGNGKGTKETN